MSSKIDKYETQSCVFNNLLLNDCTVTGGQWQMKRRGSKGSEGDSYIKSFSNSPSLPSPLLTKFAQRGEPPQRNFAQVPKSPSPY